MSWRNPFEWLRHWIHQLIRLWPISYFLGDISPAGQENVATVTRDTSHAEYLTLTDDEVARASNQFVESLVPEKIEALASRYHGGRKCRIVDQARGSYNACFFVKFDDEEIRVVRIPIAPALYKPWQALLSEVATLE